MKNNKGITLVALVVTIVVLLILAGVSINLVLGDNGIIAKAKDAETKSAEASQNDLKGMNALTEEMNNALGEKPKVDLSKYKIGDYVNYTYDTAENYVLTLATCGSSSNPADGIPQTTGLKWRILNIDEANGTVVLVSEKTTGTTVYFSNIFFSQSSLNFIYFCLTTITKRFNNCIIIIITFYYLTYLQIIYILIFIIIIIVFV